jgi:hypothetical protein
MADETVLLLLGDPAVLQDVRDPFGHGDRGPELV